MLLATGVVDGDPTGKRDVGIEMTLQLGLAAIGARLPSCPPGWRCLDVQLGSLARHQGVCVQLDPPIRQH